MCVCYMFNHGCAEYFEPCMKYFQLSRGTIIDHTLSVAITVKTLANIDTCKMEGVVV
jgi:hypothetical protein